MSNHARFEANYNLIAIGEMARLSPYDQGDASEMGASTTPGAVRACDAGRNLLATGGSAAQEVVSCRAARSMDQALRSPHSLRYGPWGSLGDKDASRVGFLHGIGSSCPPLFPTPLHSSLVNLLRRAWAILTPLGGWHGMALKARLRHEVSGHHNADLSDPLSHLWSQGCLGSLARF